MAGRNITDIDDFEEICERSGSPKQTKTYKNGVNEDDPDYYTQELPEDRVYESFIKKFFKFFKKFGGFLAPL